jgi:hypothetical protein
LVVARRRRWHGYRGRRIATRRKTRLKAKRLRLVAHQKWQVNELPPKHETKKIHSRWNPAGSILLPIAMKRLVLFTLAATLFAETGCHIFSTKKNPVAPKESKTVATDVEKDFMQRWIEKRAADLVAKGSGPDAAHVQAVADYKAAYAYTRTVQQAN